MAMSDDDDDDVPCLPADTLAALQAFLQGKDSDEVDEDWQLSQFWYDTATATSLASAARSLLPHGGKLGLISCPTIMDHVLKLEVSTTLFEFDKRFEQKYGDSFVKYDYKTPVDVPERFHHSFDVIIADPPFLSEECLQKTSETILLLKKSDCKLILCTGAVMQDLATKLLDVKPCSFVPKHRNNLANEFRCFTNFGEFPNI